MIVLFNIIPGMEMNVRYFWRTLYVCHTRISEADNQFENVIFYSWTGLFGIFNVSYRINPLSKILLYYYCKEFMEFAYTDSDNRPGLSLKEKKCGHQAVNQTSVAKVSS
jgi:hypothetical protein